jgi:hypothetical protein
MRSASCRSSTSQANSGIRFCSLFGCPLRKSSAEAKTRSDCDRRKEISRIDIREDVREMSLG